MPQQVDFYNVNYRSLYNTQNVKDAVVFVGKSKLIALVVYNNSSSTVYLQTFDASALPAGGTAPSVAPLAIAGNSTASVDFSSIGGLPMTNGIVWAESSTALTLTLAASADLMVTAVYAALAN